MCKVLLFSKKKKSSFGLLSGTGGLLWVRFFLKLGLPEKLGTLNVTNTKKFLA